MALEIERKFLPRDESWRTNVLRSVPMKQAYLGGDGVSIRVRLAGDVATINIKQMRLGREREEFEYPVPLEDGLRLYALAGGGKVAKTRHYLRHGGLLWEIDEFEERNAGLVVAEVELEAVDQAVELPPWAGEEVTEVDRYYNVALAIAPFDTWEDA
ncbi:MAG: CYTH domain-containing protein [Xanthomonadales bacterium]|jgi:adenylate cyclase|nr:CYTH domain-containing protein [Xanthomonadales bacterium]